MEKEEILDIVNANDKVIGKAPRSHVHDSKLWHRGIHIILFDSHGRMILQKRKVSADKSPGKYDLSVSGHLSSGEKYDETAFRELYEELGLRLDTLERIIRLRLEYGEYDNMISVLYKGKCEANTFSEEILASSSIRQFSPNQIKLMLTEKPQEFSKWAREILKWYFGLKTEISVLEKY